MLRADWGEPAGVVVDIDNEWMYWTNGTGGPPYVQRCNIDGSNVVDIVTSLSYPAYPAQLALDPTRGHLYVSDTWGGRIWRCNYDGSELVEAVAAVPYPWGLTIDVAGGKLYWTYADGDGVGRANLDGTGKETLIPRLYDFGNSGIVLNLHAGKIYWGASHPQWIDYGRVLRANLDGSDVEELIPFGVGSPKALAIDAPAGTLYWSDRTSKTVQRCDLNASNCITFLDGLQSAASSIYLETVNNQLYWIGSDNTWVFEQFTRIGTDGANPTAILVTLTAPDGLAVDPEEGLLFWTNDYIYFPSVRKATRRGSYGSLVTMTPSPSSDVAVDPVNKQLYSCAGATINDGQGIISRMRYDGTDVQSLPLSDLSRPIGLEIEPVAGDLYFADVWAWKVRRSSLDGSAAVELAQGNDARNATDVCVDPVRGKMYWLASETNGFYYRGLLQWSDLDGNNVETLYRAEWDVQLYGLALDVQRSNLYFSNPKTRKVYRANLDGTGMEDVVEFPEGVAPRRLAFDPMLPGDCDQNGSVNQGDWRGLFECLTGPKKTAGSQCDCADLAFDGRIDLRDAADWTRRLSVSPTQ